MTWRSFLLPHPRALITRLAVMAGLFPVAGWLGGSHWFLDLFNHFQVQYAVFLAVCVTLLAWMKAFRMAGLAAALLILPVIRIAPQKAVARDGPAIRIATFNVLSSNRRHADTVNWIEEARPDVVFLPEYTPRWSDGLRVLRKNHPHVIEHFEGGNFGFALYSKLPLLSHEVVSCGELELPYLKATLAGPRGTFTFFGAHPIPPMGSRNAADRDRYLKDLADAVAAEPLPAIVAGDLNATPWSRGMAPLQKAGLIDAAAGQFPKATWKRDLPLVAIPIDHILFRGPGTGARGFLMGPNLGSDHRPLLAEIVFSSPAGAPESAP